MILDYLVNDSGVAVKIVWFSPSLVLPLLLLGLTIEYFSSLLRHQLLLQKLRVGLSDVSFQHLLAAMIYTVTHLLACRLDKGLLPPQQSWFGVIISSYIYYQ
uniref:Uncharacterized protein n=1 Tax=Oryza nivara TaxID=4536 RepID=A0A0E0HQU8_ORYNI